MSLIAPSGSLTSASAAAAVATAQTPGPSVVLATPLPQQPISTPAVAGNLALTPATLIQPGPAPGPSVVANPPPTSASPAPQQSTSSGTGSRSNVRVLMGTMPTAALMPAVSVASSRTPLNTAAATLAAAASLPSQSASLPATTQTLSGCIPTLQATSTANAPSVCVPGGLFLGDSLAPLPQKLVQKIVNLQFVEMSELLPEAWLLEDEQSSAHFKRRKGPVTDILQWVQCFATVTAVLATAYPSKVPELMAYMSTIIKCHREFEGPCWVLYDRAFRRQAEVSKDLNWSKVNTSLFNLCFAGRARRRSLCQHCLSDGHQTDGCPELCQLPPMQLAAFQLPPPGMQPFLQPVHPTQAAHRPPRNQVEICRLFNARGGSKCTYPTCRFAHICARCRRNGHGAGDCSAASDAPSSSTKRPRL